MAGKTLLVAHRELLENLRTKTFWIGILAFPVLIAVSLGAGYVLNKLKETQRYAVIDHSPQQIAAQIEGEARAEDLGELARLLATDKNLRGAVLDLQRELGPRLAQLATADGNAPEIPADVKDRLARWFRELPAAEAEQFVQSQGDRLSASKYRLQPLAELGVAELPPAEQERRLGELIQQKKLFAYFVIGAEPEQSLTDFRYVSNNFTDNKLRTWYANAATKVVQRLRIDTAGIPADVAQRIRERVTFHEEKIKDDGTRDDVKIADKAGGYAPVVFVYLLWIAVFTAAQMLLTNTVEEKSNRIIEVLLSSVSPGQLMAGKIWGIAATGMTITVSWAVCALLGLWTAEQLMPGVNLEWAEAARDPLYLASFVVYFLLGYLLYAAILVGLGSVTNSLKEAQNLLQPVFILLFVPLVSMFFVVEEPNGIVAKVLSYVPLFTPFTMMNRAGGPPEVYEYAITGVLLLASVWLAFKAAGKVFRVGVLMTGNPPKLREILGWLREK